MVLILTMVGKEGSRLQIQRFLRWIIAQLSKKIHERKGKKKNFFNSTQIIIITSYKFESFYWFILRWTNYTEKISKGIRM